MLENRRKSIEMDALKKKQMLNRKAVKSRKSYDSMDREKQEKYLNAIRNQSAIAQQNYQNYQNCMLMFAFHSFARK